MRISLSSVPEIQKSILNGLFIAGSEQCETGCQQKTNVNINKYNWDRICCMAEEVSLCGHTDKVRNQYFKVLLSKYLLFHRRCQFDLRDQFKFFKLCWLSSK